MIAMITAMSRAILTSLAKRYILISERAKGWEVSMSLKDKREILALEDTELGTVRHTYG